MSRFASMLTAFCRIALAVIFWIAVRLFHDVEIEGLEHAAGKQPTYFAMAHKRDVDPIIEVPSVLAHRGLSALTSTVSFSMRGDAFIDGFLGRIVSRPRWLARALRWLSLGIVLNGLGIRPLENLHVRHAEVWIREWLSAQGDAQSSEVLTQSFLQEIAVRSGCELHQLQRQPLSSLLSWQYHAALQYWYSADIFSESARKVAKQLVLDKFKQQMSDLTSWLASGKSLWGAPEGKLSPDGKSGTLSASFYRLLQESPSHTCVLPLSISYDYMTTHRVSVFIRLAPPIQQVPLLARKELETQLRQSWLLRTTITCSQLASGFLIERSKTTDPAFMLDDLSEYLYERAQHFIEAGWYVDRRLLNQKKCRKLGAGFLKYALRHQIIRSTGRHTWTPKIESLNIQVEPGEVGYKDFPLVYAYNELQEIVGLTQP